MLAVPKANNVNCYVWLLSVGRVYLRCLACCALLQGVLLPEELAFALLQPHAGTVVDHGSLCSPSSMHAYGLCNGVAALQGVLLPEDFKFVLQQRHAGTAVLYAMGECVQA
jgi:hypothetical protein